MRVSHLPDRGAGHNHREKKNKKKTIASHATCLLDQKQSYFGKQSSRTSQILMYSCIMPLLQANERVGSKHTPSPPGKMPSKIAQRRSQVARSHGARSPQRAKNDIYCCCCSHNNSSARSQDGRGKNFSGKLRHRASFCFLLPPLPW